jgi:hypothetical protein
LVFDDLIRVGQTPTEEVRDESDAGTKGKRRWALPLDLLDVDIPDGSIVRIG